MGRLGGGQTRFKQMVKGQLLVGKSDTVSEAIRLAQIGDADQIQGRKKDPIPQLVWREALGGNAERLEREMAAADLLIDEAILIDPRLNKRHSWVVATEGLDACPALVASGEEACCLDRRRLRLADESHGAPYRVVISTDGKEFAKSENVVAFIAAAKLAMQFRPLEIWWQGAWLTSDGGHTGVVVLAPLVKGTMDFARVQFFLSHPNRDSVSHRLNWYHSVVVPNRNESSRREITYQDGPGRADRAFMEADAFISEKAIPTEPWRIASMAAEWAGLEPQWRSEVSGYEATQRWEPERERKPESKEDRERWDRAWKKQQADEKREAEEARG